MLVVERLEGGDVEALAQVAGQDLRERYGATWVREHLRAGSPRCLVARSVPDNRMLGFVIAEEDDAAEGRLLALAIDRIHRDEGVGGALLRSVQDMMAREGRMRLHLDVPADDGAALAFYRRHGFAPLGLREHAYQDGRDAVLMARPLR